MSPCLHNEEGTLHVCAPSVWKATKRRHRCPNCKKRTTFVTFIYEWYGADSTCLACGDRWCDGEWMERPFCRGWRQESIKHARERWARWQKREGK